MCKLIVAIELDIHYFCQFTFVSIILVHLISAELLTVALNHLIELMVLPQRQKIARTRVSHSINSGFELTQLYPIRPF